MVPWCTPGQHRAGRHSAGRHCAGRHSALAFLGVWLLLAASGTAQRLPFHTFSSDDGLAESVVLSLRQDTDGYLWFGTPNGISRFDGLEFVSFDERDGLPSNVVRWIHEDHSGRLWVATDVGLGRANRDGTEWQGVGPRVGTRCLTEGADGSLWVGTWGEGVLRLDLSDLADAAPAASASTVEATTVEATTVEASTVEASTVETYTPAHGLGHLRVRTCFTDSRGDLWFGTYGGGVSRWLPHSESTAPRFQTYGTAEGLTNLAVRALAEDPEGRLLAGTDRGIFRLEGDRFAPILADDPRTQSIISALLHDRRGRLWFGTRDNGACHWDHRAVTCLRTADGLADNSLTDLLEDREGSLWFGTFGGGASQLTSESFIEYTADDGLPGPSVQSFAQAGDALWIGTHGGGLVRLLDGRFDAFTTADGLPHDKVLTLAAAGVDRDTLWIGTLEGAALWRDGRFESLTQSDGLVHDAIFHILVDRRGGVWFATLEGLGLWREGRFQNPGPPVPKARINHIIEGRDGGYWLATDQGLVHLSVHWGTDTATPTYSVEHFREADGLADDYVNWLLERDDGLWIATVRGLNRWRDGRFETLTTVDGLSSDKCTVLAEDIHGRLWIGTTRGVNIYDGETFTAFTTHDGLESSEVNPGAALRHSNGRVWFGTVRGMAAFDPDAHRMPPPPPLLRLTAVTANGRPLDLGTPAVLDPGENTLRFDFAAITHALPEGVVYEIRLGGHGDTWRRIDGRTVEYAALASGDYRFEVRAAHQGAWSPTVDYAFTIRQPFYTSAWFLTGASLVLVGLAWALHRRRLQDLDQRALELAAEVDARTAEADRERQIARRRNEQLEITHLIAEKINAELELDDLLRAIIEGACFLTAADTALVLVLDEVPGTYNEVMGTYSVRADLRWPDLPHDPPPVPRAAVERAFLEGTREVSPGVHGGRANDCELPATLGRCPEVFLTLVIELDQRTLGLLVCGRSQDDGRFETQAAESLQLLRDHLVSAFIKGRMMDELRRLNATKDEFLGIAAHDLRSPLGGIKSIADLLLRLLQEDRLEKPLAQRFLGNVRITADQMLTLVDNLLDVAAIETGRVELSLETHRLAELLEEREAMHRPAAREKDITLDIELPTDECCVHVDRHRIAEVVDNLLTNAVKYTHRGGHVRLHCQRNDDTMTIHVQDNGQGLPADEVDDAFTGRKLTPQPTGGEKSTGLGLVIVKKIVDLHGGRVWVESEAGKGSTFSFSVPRA